MSRPSSARKVKSGAGRPSKSSRAVGIVRVSRVGERGGESFVSPKDQRQRIHDVCEREGIELVDVFEERDVSGGAELEQRPGLRRAVEMIEAGDARVIVVAYFDRLVRNVRVQQQVTELVEKAGGAILAADIGEVGSATASRWLSSTLLGAVSEYHRRVTGERTQDAKRRAVARGVAPYPNIPAGYMRLDDGRLTPSGHAAVIAEAFERRAAGATVREVRAYLNEHGVPYSFHGTQAMLSNRIYLGELRFGDLVNEHSHAAIVDTDTFRKVQRVKVSRGRRPRSDRLLARLGILRCGTCGGRMSTGTTRQGNRIYGFYRCSPTSDCPNRVTISADLVERQVRDEVARLLAGVIGSAAAEHGLTQAELELEQAETALERAVRAFDVLDDVDAVRDRLVELRDARDRARDRVDDLRALAIPSVTVTADDWDLLTLDERRDLIRAVLERVVVAPGRGADRVSFQARL